MSLRPSKLLLRHVLIGHRLHYIRPRNEQIRRVLDQSKDKTDQSGPGDPVVRVTLLKCSEQWTLHTEDLLSIYTLGFFRQILTFTMKVKSVNAGE